MSCRLSCRDFDELFDYVAGWVSDWYPRERIGVPWPLEILVGLVKYIIWFVLSFTLISTALALLCASFPFLFLYEIITGIYKI